MNTYFKRCVFLPTTLIHKYFNSLTRRYLNTCKTTSMDPNGLDLGAMFENKQDEPIIWPVRVPEFGEQMRKEFLLDENVTFLNHCGKGAVPRIVHLQQIRYQHKFHFCCIVFYSFSLVS